MNADRLNKKIIKITHGDPWLSAYDFHLTLEYRINTNIDRFYNLKTKLELKELDEIIEFIKSKEV